MAEDDQLELRLGRIGARERPGRLLSLQSRLIGRIRRSGVHPRPKLGNPAREGPRRSGRFNARGRGALAGALAARASPWSVDPSSGLRVRARRVVVKARVVRLAGGRAAASAPAHLRYLQRDGVARDGEHGGLYSASKDEADGKAFLERGEGDRHQFRLIVSPEDGAAFDDLRAFTRELMGRMEVDLRTRLDWVAVDHFDTGHPHAHILLRGVTEEGRVLNIAGDYIAHGIRGRASEIMTRWLGPQSELEVREQLARDVDAERLTPLDRSLLGRAVEGRVDLATGRADWDADGAHQQLLVSRARRLERMALATREGPLVWRLSPDLEKDLGALGRRGDIIRTLHLAVSAAKLGRRAELYVVDDPATTGLPVLGTVIASGAADDHHERLYLVVDGADGRTHYLDIGRSEEPVRAGSLVELSPAVAELRPADRAIAAVAAANGGIYGVDLHLRHDPGATQDFAAAHLRRLEALRRSGAAAERRPDGSWSIPADFLDRALAHERARQGRSPWTIRQLSPLPLDRQVVAEAPTWLDRRLLGDTLAGIAEHGHGADIRQALGLRRQWLLGQGLARLSGEEVLLAPDLEARLRQRELTAAGARLARELGLEQAEPDIAQRIAGVVRRRLDLASGSYAVLADERSFTLVPWRPVLGQRLGQEVSGVVRRSGAISWSFGRERPGPAMTA